MPIGWRFILRSSKWAPPQCASHHKGELCLNLESNVVVLLKYYNIMNNLKVFKIGLNFAKFEFFTANFWGLRTSGLPYFIMARNLQLQFDDTRKRTIF